MERDHVGRSPTMPSPGEPQAEPTIAKGLRVAPLGPLLLRGARRATFPRTTHVKPPLLLVRMRPTEETIFRCRRKHPETKAAYFPLPSNGDCHVGPHPERDLPRIPQRRSSRHRPRRGKGMTEVVTALFVFFSISVFLAHAFDAYRMR